MDIDLIYLWVDGSDPQWLKKHDACIGKTEVKSAVNCKGRYANNDELKYSLRSVEMYAPWIRRIYIVTDNQTPAWLNHMNPRVRIIDHKEIMPEVCLPCFNSIVIEHFLYKIPGLSEHFLYANDDMFINKPVTPDDFFASDGLPIIRLNSCRLRNFYLLFRKTFFGIPVKNFVQTVHNAARLVEKKYGVNYRGSKPHHNIDAYLKSDYERIEQMFKHEIEPTLPNRVRRNNDIERSLITYAAMAEKRGHTVFVNRKTSFRFHIENMKHYGMLESYNPLLFCMNDSEYATDEDRMKVKEFLEKRFPKKSEFER